MAMRWSVTLVVLGMAALVAASGGQTVPATSSDKPTLWVIGDSTVRNNTGGGLGWGTPLAQLFDPAKITINNSAIAGRSARSFYSEGRWDGPAGVKGRLKAGDFVLMQFGTNDGPGNEQQIANSTNGRPDLAGIGEETTTGPDSSPQRKMQTVHTFGWYMRIYVADTKAKGATPIMLTMVPQNRWTADGKIQHQRQMDTFCTWCAQIAKEQNCWYINLNDVTARRFEKEGQQAVSDKYFAVQRPDATHTNPAGALFNAESVVMGVRALKDLKLNEYLSEAGMKLAPAEADDVAAPAAVTQSGK